MPTVKDAAEVAACPTKGKAGSITVARICQSAYAACIRIQSCICCTFLSRKHTLDLDARLARQTIAPDITVSCWL